jgi:hypothetical protein
MASQYALTTGVRVGALLVVSAGVGVVEVSVPPVLVSAVLAAEFAEFAGGSVPPHAADDDQSAQYQCKKG